MMRTADRGFELRGESTKLKRLLTDAWEARYILHALSRRDFFTRYRRPTLGAIWSVLSPVIQAAVLAVVFTRVVRVHTAVPYLLFVLSGIIPWTFFSGTLTTAVKAIVGGTGIASKVYFPRCILPLSNVGTSFYGYVPSLVVMVIVALLFGVHISLLWLMLVPATIVMVLLTSAFSLVLAGMQVYFRDVNFIITAATQAWFYGSAVFFPLTLVPKGPLRNLVIINPASGMVELFRVAFLGFRPYTGPMVAWTMGWTVGLLIVSALMYKRYDRVFIDLL